MPLDEYPDLIAAVLDSEPELVRSWEPAGPRLLWIVVVRALHGDAAARAGPESTAIAIEPAVIAATAAAIATGCRRT